MTIIDILRTLARYRRVAVIVGLVTLVLGFLAAFRPPDRYRATATVLVQPKLIDGAPAPVQIVDFLVPTMLEIAKGRSFVTSAGREVPAAVRDDIVAVAASTSSGSSIITITASGTNQEAVAPWAQAIADRLVDASGNRYVELSAIERADRPDKPYAPRRDVVIQLTIALALANALLAAVIASAVRGGGDRAAELRERFGAAVLGEIPRVRRSLSDLRIDELLTHPGAAAAAEALQALRANAEFALSESEHPWLVVTSTREGEGKSTIATALAWLFASVNRPTILVDGDLRRPTANRRIGAPVGLGLPAVGTHDLARALQSTPEPHLRFLGSGMPDRHPAEIASEHVPHLVRQAAETGDVVVIDSPPLPIAAETIIYAMACQNVLLVIDARQRDLSHVERAITALQDRDVHLLGVVINRSRRKLRYRGYSQASTYQRSRVADVEAPSPSSPSLPWPRSEPWAAGTPSRLDDASPSAEGLLTDIGDDDDRAHDADVPGEV